MLSLLCSRNKLSLFASRG